MDWLAAVDIYCERTSAAFWAEPVNALTNLAVLGPVVWAVSTARRLGERDPAVWVLIGLGAAIGAGSFLFHTVATRWTEVADTLPIWSFLALYAFVGSARLLGLKPARRHAAALAVVAALVLVFFANGEGAVRAADALPEADALNGSGQYLPVFLGIVVFVAGVWWHKHPMRRWVSAAALAFALAVTLRSIDAAACTDLPLGTHFLWHLFNCLTLGLALQALLRSPVGVKMKRPPLAHPSLPGAMHRR